MHADPALEARQLFDFLEVSADPGVVDDVVRATTFEAQSGRKPGEEDPNSFLRKGVAGDWIGLLEPSAVGLLETVCGPLMRENGYT